VWGESHCAFSVNIKKLSGLSPRANYTDRATASCRRSWCQLLKVEGCSMVSATDLQGHILGFLDRSHYFFFSSSSSVVEARGSLLVKALGYKPKGCGFETRWDDIFNLPNPSCRTRPRGLLSL
jgi:hypothetical protein